MSAMMSEATVVGKVLDGERITAGDAVELYRLPLNELGQLADCRRQLAKAGAYQGKGNDIVTYIVDRNINYTNVCNVYCKFCAFYRTERDADHYVLTHEEIEQKIDELVAIGGIQILMQGGHHPKLGIEYYLDLLGHIREKYPQINIHAFSPPEFNHFAEVFGMPLREVIQKFKEAGLGSIPGGGGEILVDRVRNRISPLKCNTAEWLDVMRIAHELGLNSSATMMFGHVEAVEDRIEHLERIRELQDQTGGFTAFICWTFQPENVVLKATPVGSAEYLRMQALSRIYLDNIDNIQSSWVTQGPKIGQIALRYGANDFGSVMMEENVVSKAGTSFRITRDEIEYLISEAGYEPHTRNNWYELTAN
jgi:cyclic dehypoxanthinyl futalosine synthase